MSIRPTPNSELAQRFPGLLGLSRDYINLSWDFEYDEPEQGVLAFAATRPDLVSSCADGIDFVLTECADEPMRLQTLAELGWGYAPHANRLDAFLTWTRNTLRRSRSHDEIAAS